MTNALQPVKTSDVCPAPKGAMVALCSEAAVVNEEGCSGNVRPSATPAGIQNARSVENVPSAVNPQAG
jgi:hypothetical protein